MTEYPYTMTVPICGFCGGIDCGCGLNGWKRMTYAPRDGSRVLVCDGYGVACFVVWAEGDPSIEQNPRFAWRCQRNLPSWEPDYWYPLPAAPNRPIFPGDRV